MPRPRRRPGRRYTEGLDGFGIPQGRMRPVRRLGARATTLPGSRTSGCSPSSTVARSPRGSRSPTASNILVYKDLGLVSPGLRRGHPHHAARRPRRSGTPATRRPARPPGRTRSRCSRPTACARLALGHNGNLVNTPRAAPRRSAGGARHHRQRPRAATIAGASAPTTQGLERRCHRGAPDARRARSVRVHGRAERVRRARPLRRPAALDRPAAERASCVASETCALDIVGAHFVRDVEPGELVRIDDRGLHSMRFAESPSHGAAASSSSSTSRGPTRACYGRRVHEARRRDGPPAGAEEHPVDADLVMRSRRPATRPRRGTAEVVGHPVRRRAHQEPLRRPHVHRALAVARAIAA